MNKLRHAAAALMFVLSMGMGQGAETDAQPQPVPLTPLKPFVAILQENPKLDSGLRMRDRGADYLWLASLTTAGAASALDATTSWGKREGNGFLASSNGSFGARGLSIKAGLFAAVLIPQVMFRNHEGFRKRFAIANFIEAGIFTGISVHNMGVTQPR